MSSGYGLAVTSGDHDYDGTRHFTSSQSGVPTLRDSSLGAVVVDQIGGETIQITENGSIALIPLLKAAGLEIPQLPTDPALRVRTLHATWIAVLGILSKKGRAGLEAKNRSIEVPRIVQMNPETLAKFRALRVEVVEGRPVRVPTGRNTSASSDDPNHLPLCGRSPTPPATRGSHPALRSRESLRDAPPAPLTGRGDLGTPKTSTPHFVLGRDDSESSRVSPIMDPHGPEDSGLDNRLAPWGTPHALRGENSVLDLRNLQVGIPTSSSSPHPVYGVDHSPHGGRSPPAQQRLQSLDPPSRSARESQGYYGDLVSSMTRPMSQSTFVNEELNTATSPEPSKAYYDEVKWDPALSTSNQSIIPHSNVNVWSLTRPGSSVIDLRPPTPPTGRVQGRASTIGPPPGFQMMSRNPGGRPSHDVDVDLIDQTREAHPARSEKTPLGRPSPTARGAVPEMVPGPPYRILQRKKPEEELKISAVENSRSDPVAPLEGARPEGAAPMSDTQLGRQVLQYIKSQSNGQLEGRAIGAVAKNIYNSYREIAVHKSRDPNLLDRIEKAIVQLGQSNQIQLGINGKRFPIHPPRGEHLRHRFSASELEQIYSEHREGLSQVNSFNAAARILANSSSRWKHLDRAVAEQLAAAAVTQLIENNLFR